MCVCLCKIVRVCESVCMCETEDPKYQKFIHPKQNLSFNKTAERIRNEIKIKIDPDLLISGFRNVR